MKILVVHNYYGASAPSGENKAVDNEIELLRRHHHDVIVAARYSDEIRKHGNRGDLTGALSFVWNPSSKRKLAETVEQVKPDIVHVHNVFPLHSPSIFYGIKNVPVVYTLHNYRLGCAAGTATRNNRLCFDCFERHSVMPAIKYGCYRNSRAATMPMAVSIALHKMLHTWTSHVGAFVTLTEFQRNVMVNFGLPVDRLFVKPHFGVIPDSVIDWGKREEKVVFIGRLYEAKGIHLAINAWKKMGDNAPQLEIIGDGPLRKELEETVTAFHLHSKIKFTGQIPHNEAMVKLSAAKMLLLPSLCPEGFPMVVHEAYARGVPVAASNAGSLQSLVKENQTGILFSPGNVDEIASHITSVWNNNELLHLMQKNAINEFTEHYTGEKNHAILMDIYSKAQEHRRNNKS